jgi:hypothetical protein
VISPAGFAELVAESRTKCRSKRSGALVARSLAVAGLRQATTFARES